MTPTLRPYPTYRRTDLPWLASLPDRWELLRNKHIWREVNARSTAGAEELLTVSQYTGVTRRRDGLSADGALLTNAESLAGHKRVARNDLVVNIMLAWNGSLGVSAHDGIVSPAYAVFRIKTAADPHYFHYLYRSPVFTGLFKTVSTGVVDSRLRLYPEVFFRLLSPVPPPSEQAAIVRFLDHSDRHIRRYIAAKRRLIAKLNEQKSAVIDEAVTRGLDSTASFRSPRTLMLREVPAHWELLKVKHCLRAPLAYGVLKPDKYDGLDAVPLVRITDVANGRVITDRLERISPRQDAEFARTRVEPGDVIVSVVGTIGRSAVIPQSLGHVNLSRALCRVRLSSRIRSDFFHLYCQSRVFLRQAESIPSGTAQRVLNLGDLRQFNIAVPPIEEQAAIVDYLKGTVARYDQLIASAAAGVALVRDYRTRLFADVVTGRIDVRAEAAALPEAQLDAPVEPDVPNDLEAASVDDAVEVVEETEA